MAKISIYNKRQCLERRAIIERMVTRPYASQVAFEIGIGGYEFPRACSILGSNGSIIELQTKKGEKEDEVRTISVSQRGFATASEAEKEGLKLSQAILWSAIVRQTPLRLTYHTPYPTLVYDRTSSGMTLICDSRMYTFAMFPQFVETLMDGLDIPGEVDKKLLVSMELFTSARLEATERTKFLGLVSSLEPIADQKPYGTEVSDLLDSFIATLGKTEINSTTKDSLRGSLLRLKQESVSYAIRRMIGEMLPNDPSAIELVKHAYDVRSKLLHDGHADADLVSIASELDSLVRRLISIRFGKPLAS